MKKNFILFSLVLLTQCGGEAPADVNSLMKNGNLADLQTLKTKKQKELNQLKQDIDKLDSAIRSQDAEKKLLLGTDMILESQEFKHYVAFQGTIDTDQNLVIYPEIPALLQTIYVQEGQRVKKGTALVKLSDGGLQDQLEQMRLQLALAKTTFERQQTLWDQKIGSEIQYLQAKTNYNTLEKSVSQMKDQVAKTLIKAPFDGIVDHIIADKGANLAPGATPILRFVNLDQMHVTGEIPEIHLPNIQLNSEAKVTIPVLRKQWESKVSLVGNYINPNNRSFRIEIELDNKEGSLKPNMTAQVLLNDYTNSQALLVPLKNILKNQDGQSYVFLLENIEGEPNTYKAIKTFVETGIESNNAMEIIKGLQVGDRILQEGVRLAKDQQRIKIINS
ncbi:MAG: efflux RND transporter periplasmic adaptor subunit [Flavobacteriaceae bacterium TMED120]|jgi:membrane fusion protein (multidrug efflux system)|nr:MAG: efflux RND transporter periplasmic adaptor subunit [Flavobacteriaceae bacterium TMED120]CAI8231277.1 MAG: Cobalt-zinc-cadmium resistance protein CzcB [Flavobacteriaceae bacterium]HCQ23928.1 efflux RND transporter periplasmic adaptor subunit [Flavobacteriaceae bacterium]|tara:strand:- start:270 stop:1439 length:1170 start_codon:yes stop_codon:yes gene_type:complete